MQQFQLKPVRPPILVGGTPARMGVVHTLFAFFRHDSFSFHFLILDFIHILVLLTRFTVFLTVLTQSIEGNLRSNDPEP